MIEKIIVLMCIVSAIAATADKPAATADKPAATADEHAATADKHTDTAVKSAATADKHTATADKPADTAVKPAATADKPNSTANKSNSTASKSNSTASKPNSTASKSNSTASKPNSTASKSNSTASKPNSTASKSNSTASKSNSTASKPNSTASKSNSTASKPNSTASKSNSTASKSNSTASKPNSTASKPAATADKHAATPKKPTNKSATANKSDAKAGKAVASASPSTFENVDPNTLSCDPNGHIFLLLPHFEHCNKFFMCAHGNEVEFNCAPGTIFDFVLQVCNHPWATKCILRTRPGEEDIEGSGEEEFDWLTDNADHGYVGSANSLTADEVSNSVRPLNIETPGKSPNFNTVLNCLRPDSASRQVPYKGDCQRYWHCTNGVPKTAYCSDGLFFNELLQQCDFEANAKCTDLNDELSNEFIVYKKH